MLAEVKRSERRLTMKVVPVAGILMAGCSAAEQRAEVFVVPAPDRARRAFDASAAEVWAEIVSWEGESGIRINWEEKGERGYQETRYLKTFFAGNGQGSTILRAAWSPVGPCLAYQRASSGGHQPYWSPITVVNTANPETEEVDLDKMVQLLHPEPEWTAVTADSGEFFWSADGKLHFFALIGEDGKHTQFTYDPNSQEIVDLGSNATASVAGPWLREFRK